MKRHILALAALMLAAISVQASSVRLSESPGRGKRTVEVGDIFYIFYEVADLDAAPETPKNIPGAKLMYFERTGQSSSFSMVNGKTTQSKSFTYTATLRATAEGSYTFGPVTVGGVKSNAVSYTIGRESPAPQPAQAGASPGGAARSQSGSDDPDKPKYIGKGDANLFLRANISSTTAWEQQALVYTVKLYTTYDAIKFIGASAAPKFEGFVIEESKDISNSLSYETYQGKTYATAVIARYIIFPQMTGNLKVSGNTYTVSVDRREYYHDPFFGSMSYATPLQLNVTPNDLVISVKALPSPRPADFSGAVGDFKVSSQLKSQAFKSNQAASIVYTVTGTGNLRYVQLPDLAAMYPPELEVYTPTVTPDIKVGSSSVSGKVTFDYSFMPLDEGEFRIPDLKFVYFDPSAATYRTSVAKGYDLNVGRGKASAAPRLKGRFLSDLHQVDAASLAKSHKAAVRGNLFWLWYAVPLLLLVGLWLAYRRHVDLHADMAAFNSRRADRLARRRLKRAATAMKAGNRDLFYDEILASLWGYLGDKLRMPTSELMRDNIRQVLESRGIPADDTEALIAEIDKAEFAKYASGQNTSDLKAAYDSAAALINRLEKSFGRS